MIDQVFIDGLRIREERERTRQYSADQAFITVHYCGMCGTRLNAAGHCPHGCLDNSTAAAVIAAYPPRPQIAEPDIHVCTVCGAQIACGFLCTCEEPVTSVDNEYIVNGQA